MLNTSRSLPLSPFSDLYDILLPKDNLYRRLADEIDYSFVYEALSPLYDSRRGRYGVDPDRMIKILMLKAMTEMSDRDLVEEINYNLIDLDSLLLILTCNSKHFILGSVAKLTLP